MTAKSADLNGRPRLLLLGGLGTAKGHATFLDSKLRCWWSTLACCPAAVGCLWGLQVILAGRNAQRGKEAVEEVKAEATAAGTQQSVDWQEPGKATWMQQKLWMTSFGTLAAWHCVALALSRDAWLKDRLSMESP
eukprot:Skav223126  [mRNA]  locus=scaffold470:40352:42538:+ [translate_table: standard]